MNKIAYELGKKFAADEIGPYEMDNALDLLGYDEMIKANEYNRAKHPGHYFLNPYVGGPLREAVNRIGRRHTAFEGENPLAYYGITLGAPAIGAALGAALGKQSSGFFNEKDRTQQGALAGASLGALTSATLPALLGGEKTQQSLREKGKKSLKDMAREKKSEELGPYDADAAARIKAVDYDLAAIGKNRESNLGHYLFNPFVRGPLSEFKNMLDQRFIASVDTNPYLWHPVAAAAGIHPLTSMGANLAAIALGDEGRQNQLRDMAKEKFDPIETE